MNTEARKQEYELIREEQALLRRRMARLDEKIEAMFAAEVMETPSAPVPEPTPAPLVETPPPLPLVALTPALVSVPEEVPAPASSPAVPIEKDSLEVQIGTVWLVRIGVLLILTALAFGGGYLYQHVVPRLGPAAKVALLYLGAGALAGAGVWLERRQRSEVDGEVPSAAGGFQQYARVVLAGGLAAIYYVTYAIHWNPRLRIVESPVLAGGLLLGWTAFMVYLADRRRSETLATFAILLAYYTSSVNEIAQFTLVSNLALTIAAVFLLRRHLWKVFPFASLLATFGSYGFWRYFHVYLAWKGRGEFPSSALGSSGFWIDATFLAIYWLLFTWVIFGPGEKTLSRAHEATFAGLNNGSFFALGTWALLADYPGSFWRWALGFGTVLLVLGELGRRLPRPPDARTEGTYQSGGILLVTWGLVSYFGGGWHLTLALAVESTALVVAAGRRESLLLLVASGVLSLMTLFWAVDWLGERSGLEPWLVGAAEGGFVVFNAWWSQRLRETRPLPDLGPAWWQQFRAALPYVPTYFALIGCALWFWTIQGHVTDPVLLAPSLVVAAVLLTGTTHVLRVGALAVWAQVYLFAALCFWLHDHSFLNRVDVQPAIWNPLLLIAGALAVGHWWEQRRWGKYLPPESWGLLAIFDAIFIVIVLAAWLEVIGMTGEVQIAVTAALALLIFGYGLFTRYRSLAVVGQVLQFGSILGFILLFLHGWDGSRTELFLSLAPIAGAVAVLVVVTRFVATLDRPLLLRWRSLRWFYEALAVSLMVSWGCRYFPDLGKFPLFCSLGGLIFFLGTWRNEKRWLLWSGVPVLVALIAYWGIDDLHREASLWNWFGIGVLAGQQRLGKRTLPVESFPVAAQRALMIVATLVAWTWVSAWVSNLAAEGTFSLAAGWSVFAAVVFAAGFIWRESTYRWSGLVILAATLGRIILYDIWQLDSLGRILSSFALGFALLGIAFAYIKFQKQLRNWF